MATASEQDLRYAAEVVIPVIQIVYDRYDTGTSTIIAPNVQSIADIRANTRRFAALKQYLDHTSKKLVQDLLEQPAADPTLLGTIDFDPTTATGFISFRGTKKGTEWVDDFKGIPVPFKELGAPIPWVHLGFLEIWRLARESVIAGLGQLPKVNRLLVTGHSLGSAVASLCAIEVVTRNPAQETACWTFASPRAFFGRPKRFNNTISSSIRVHNPADVVTNVPLPPFIHVTGGVAIRAKLAQFHSLLQTYQPGIEALLHAVQRGGVQLEPSEDELFDFADDAPKEKALDNSTFELNNEALDLRCLKCIRLRSAAEISRFITKEEIPLTPPVTIPHAAFGLAAGPQIVEGTVSCLPEERAMVDAAYADLQNVLVSDLFQQEVLAATFTETNGLDNQGIYALMVRRSPVSVEFSMYMGDFCANRCFHTMGYEDDQHPNTCFANRYFIQKKEVCASLILHESMHILGFRHDYVKETSVPYTMNRIYDRVAQSLGLDPKATAS